MGSDAGRVQREEQRKIDDAEPLTEEEIMEKEELLTMVSIWLNSISSWNLRQ